MSSEEGPLLKWPPGTMDTSSMDEVGIRLFYLLQSTRSWMHRQVDSLRLDAGLTNRRHVSIDFTLPEDGVVLESTHRVIVPLALMTKGTLSRLDVNDVGNKSAAVLTAEQNTFCSQLLLRAAAQLLLPMDMDTYHIHKKIDAVLEATSEQAKDAHKSVEDFIRDNIEEGTAQWNDGQIFLKLCHNFSGKFLFLISVDKGVINDRSMVKFSYDQLAPTDRRGTLVTSVNQPLHDLAKVASQHIEIRVPEGLMIKSFTVAADQDVRVREDDRTKEAGGTLSPQEIVHASLTTTARSHQSAWLLKLEPARQGLLQFARAAVITVATLMTLGTAVRLLDLPIVDWSRPVFPSPSASIILVGPALLLSWVSKQREHELLAAALEPLRKMLQLTAASLLVLAALVAIPLQASAWEVGWWVAFGLAWLSLIWLVLYFTDKPLPRWLRHWIFP